MSVFPSDFLIKGALYATHLSTPRHEQRVTSPEVYLEREQAPDKDGENDVPRLHQFEPGRYILWFLVISSETASSNDQGDRDKEKDAGQYQAAADPRLNTSFPSESAGQING